MSFLEGYVNVLGDFYNRAVKQGDIKFPPLRYWNAGRSAPTCTARVQAALDAINTTDKALNACVEVCAEEALKQAAEADMRIASGGAARTLEGVPLLVKVNVDVAGTLTTASTPGLAEHRPATTAPIVDLLLGQGAVVVAKTNMPEVALGSWGYSPVHGMTYNALNPAYTCGGSSSGSAVGLSAGLAPIAIGSDTMGSLRLPAEFSGVVGFRPSMGRYSNAGSVPLIPSKDRLGPMAVTVADVAVLDAVMAGERKHTVEPAALAGVTVCVPKDWIEEVAPAPGNLAALECAITALRAAGACIRTDLAFKPITALKPKRALSLNQMELQKYIDSHPGLSLSLDEVVNKATTGLIKAMYKSPEAIKQPPNISDKPEEQRNELLVALQADVAEMDTQIQSFFTDNKVDVVLTPCASQPPAAVAGYSTEAAFTSDQIGPTMMHHLAAYKFTMDLNDSSMPSLAMPTPTYHHMGMPAGVLLWGQPHNDKRLLQIGMGLEKALV